MMGEVKCFLCSQKFQHNYTIRDSKRLMYVSIFIDLSDTVMNFKFHINHFINNLIFIVICTVTGIAVKRKKEKSVNSEKQTKIGKFEAHTKGVGRKILEGQGWTEGQGLGSTIAGIKDALDNEGQNPRDRRGFGYVQE